MARPHPALLDLAAGRPPGRIDGDEVLHSAVDHGMQGLLWTWARDADIDPAVRRSLVSADLASRHHHRRLWETLATTVSRLSALDIEVATAKGVTAEARWYGRPGERPCSDVDLLIGPGSTDRAAEVLDALQPDHPLRPSIDELVAHGLQAVTTEVDGVAVDVHFDLLKLGVPTRHPEVVWSHTEPFALPDGSHVAVPDTELSLVHLLVHMNKDSFAWLLAFADVARILHGPLDWDVVDDFARAEGIEALVHGSLVTVARVLDLPPPPLRPGGVRGRLWAAAWPDSAILRGSAAHHRSRRQDLIPLLMRGGWGDKARWAWATTFPPASTVEARYGDSRAPYGWRLARGRIATARERRVALRQRVER